jgi:hypothetical protein
MVFGINRPRQYVGPEIQKRTHGLINTMRSADAATGPISIFAGTTHAKTLIFNPVIIGK